MEPSPAARRGLLALVLAIAAVLISSTWVGHADVYDGQLYRVVARNLVEDGTWLRLRYLPLVHTPFYEHLPFGIWVMAASIRLFGDGSLEWLFAAFSLGTVALTYLAASRLAGAWAGLAAALVLAVTPNFFAFAGHPMLDPLLVVLATGSAVALLASARDGVPPLRSWALSAFLAALAVMVKGPFGLLPACGAALAIAWVHRKPSAFLGGIALAVVAAAPVALFLLARTDWWHGYGEAQLLASASGARVDGQTGPLRPLAYVTGRFWPGLPLVLLGLVVAIGWPRRAAQALRGPTLASSAIAARLFAIASAAALVALALPGRKLWHHTLVLYPLLAMLAGAGLGPWLSRMLETASRIRATRWALSATLVIAAAYALSGLGLQNLKRPCLVSREFSSEASALSPGDAVLVIHEGYDWDVLSSLAAERRVVPWPLHAFAESDRYPEARGARFAFVHEQLWDPSAGFQEIARGGGWILARRSPAQQSTDLR